MNASNPVLIVSTSLNSGGAERVTSTLLSHLDRKRFRPELALLRNDIGYQLPSDVPVHQLGYTGLATILKSASRLRQLINELQPEAVISNIAATNLITGIALRSVKHAPPWIARIGNSPVRHDGWVRYLVAKCVYPRVNRFVVNSSDLTNELQKLYGVSKEIVSTIGNPTDYRELDRLSQELPAIRHESSDPLVIAVGRLCQQKRYDILLDAFRLILDKQVAFLWICGDGPQRSSIERRIQRLGIESNVRLLGFRKNPYSLMRQATVFLMSSDHEGLPNALIEAQCLGIPAVSTNCSYGPDDIIVNGVTGYLVPVRDASAIADATLELLTSTSIDEFSIAARNLARKRFSVDHLTQRWCEEILGVLREEPDV